MDYGLRNLTGRVGKLRGWNEKMIFCWIGFALLCFSALMILILAFQQGTAWGVVMLLFGWLLWPVFVLQNWKETSFWFYNALAGSILMYLFL